VPDWREEDGNDVIGYRARYYECGSGGRMFAAPRIEADVDYTVVHDGKAIQFSLTGLASEKEYIVQLAALTQFGQGSWSTESQRLSTWRCAPLPLAPQIILRTHTALVVGWSLNEVGRSPETLGHDEDILEFVVQTDIALSSPVQANLMNCTYISLEQATKLGQVLHEDSKFAQRSDVNEQHPLDEEIPVLAPSGGHTDEPSVFGDAMICDGILAPHLPTYAAVVRDLKPNHTYIVSIYAVSCAGMGCASRKSQEQATLALAPRIDDLQIDEVQHDRIQVSWNLPRLRLPFAQSTCEQLGLVESVAELEVVGFDVRCAASTTWTRLHWRDPEHMQIGRLQRDDNGRGYVVVSELDAGRPYIVELRACSASGAGEWCRLDKQPVCTAIDSPAPPPPELVKNTSHSLTFSFAGVEDHRIVAYQVRRYEGWMGRWGRASSPFQFNADLPGVRVTSERRWVVTIEDLQSETTHALQLRGITSTGHVTKWSSWSEAMSTLRESHGDCMEAPGITAPFPRLASPASGPSVSVSQVGKAVDMGFESANDLTEKLKAIIAFIMDYATSGVQLPSITVPSISERAASLLQENRCSNAAAVDMVSKFQDDGTWKSKLPDFLIHQAPVAGCSTLLLRELWQNLRHCAVIAHLYGHDTQSSETRALLFTCLLPQCGDGRLGTEAPDATWGTTYHTFTDGQILERVANDLAKASFVHATSMRNAGHTVGGLEATGLVLREYSVASPFSEFKFGEIDTQLAETLSMAGSAGLSAAAAEDTGPPNPTRVARALFKPPKAEEHPATILCLFALWLLPLFVSACRFAAKRLLPLLAQTIRMDLSLAGIVVLLIVAQIIGVAIIIWIQEIVDRMIRFPATFVFVVYAAAPGASIWLATRSMLKGLVVAPCFALLGLYSLGTGYLRWADDLLDDNTLERRAVPRIVWGRRRQAYAVRVHSILWAVLVSDFIIEEVLGQWCGFHSVRLLGPPQAPAGQETTTPAEYQPPAFALFIAAAAAHQHVLTLTKRQTVLVRMLGARCSQLPNLRLFLMGAPSVTGQHAEALSFLRNVSPSKWWCCLVLFLRRWGAVGGVLIPLSLYVLRDPQHLGAMPKETLVPLAMAIGAVLGHSASSSFAALWHACEGHLEAEYRVLHLFPHMSPQARDWACDALSQAVRQSTKDKATEPDGMIWAAVAMVRGTTSWAVSSIAGVLSRPGSTQGRGSPLLSSANTTTMPGGSAAHSASHGSSTAGGLRRRTASK